jgi:hypothetical protein
LTIYDYYHRRLTGDTTILPDINAPQPGFYRTGNGDPVCYFYDHGEEASDIPSAEVPLVCLRGRHDKQRRMPELEALELWPWVCQSPVAEEEWRRAYAGGEWDNEAPGLGHNRPPTHDSPEERRTKVIGLADEWLEQNAEVTTARQADQAAHMITELRNLASDLTREESERKKPFQDFVKQLIDQYRRWREPLDAARGRINQRLQPYLLKIDAQKAEDRANAERIREEAAAKGKRVPFGTTVSTRVGGTGHAVSLRSYWSAEIINYVDALEAAGAEPEVFEAVQKVADRFARQSKGKTPLRGTACKEDRR